MPTDCLRCRIGATQVALPLNEVNKISEFSITPPVPLSEPWVGGVAYLGDKVWMTLKFDGTSKPNQQQERSRKGVLFKEGAHGLRWALEIDDVVGIATLETIEENPLGVRGWTCPEQWIRKATTKEGHVVGWVDTASIVAQLKGAAAASS